MNKKSAKMNLQHIVDFELKKYSRGNWQLTPVTVKVYDLCKRMRDKTTMAYEAWTQYVITKDNEKIPCFGKGVRTGDPMILNIVIYHHVPFAAKAEYGVVGMNMEGRYKEVAIFQAFDKKNRLKSQSICVEIPGEIIRI
uniref:Uncharacterized protein n=1 Tax=Glossina brevipalpis TaxID=37001 RepID=A0A1A9WB50_9MUSC